MLIELQDLGKSFRAHEVLCGASARADRGDRIGITRPPGTLYLTAFSIRL